jgi:hypothetical protein
MESRPRVAGAACGVCGRGAGGVENEELAGWESRKGVEFGRGEEGCEVVDVRTRGGEALRGWLCEVSKYM